MPELPEVETIVRQLSDLLAGRRIAAFEVFDPLLKIAHPAALAGRSIVHLERIGKQIVMALDPAGRQHTPCWICVHLRMTGRLLWNADATAGDALRRPSPLRARWRLDRGSLLFHDTRRFGTIRLLERREDARVTGLDPLDAGCTPAALAALTRGSAQAIKPWLLRQDRLTGVGNIYASEALFVARIHPETPAGQLSPAALTRLHAALQDVLQRAIDAGGTTFSDFQNARGDVGTYQKNLLVYDHAGEPCPACRRPIERVIQQQRSTFFCPRCQRRR